MSQSKIFAQALEAAGVSTTLDVVVGHGTGGPRFAPMIKAFFAENLRESFRRKAGSWLGETKKH